MKALTLLVGVLVGALSGCCPNVTFGDPSKPIELQITFGDRTGHFETVPEGGPVLLVVGGQGSHMVVVGVRARNLTSCGGHVSGVLTDSEGRSAAEDSTENLQVLDGGWLGLESSISSAIRLPPRTADTGPWKVTTTLTAGGRVASVSQGLTLACDPDDRYCRCGVIHDPDAGC